LSGVLFLRWDGHDDDRTRSDIRELNWHKVENDWELRVGVGQVFWGVTETVHLVNIINQIDFVESLDGEELLGQPMINVTLVRNWGTIDGFILPYFRERTYPGSQGRPPSGVVVSNDKAIYESSREEWHTDFAVRWSNSIGDWDLGVYQFYGTSREPILDPEVFELNDSAEHQLIPIYSIVSQTGIDIQGTFGAWLFKLESIKGWGKGGRDFAGALGFEYTFYDISRAGFDFGIFSEYIHDDREVRETTDSDISLGVRLSLNDIESTELLSAVVQDINNGSLYYYLEASRRIGNSFKFSMEARGVSNVAEDDPLNVFASDDYVQIRLDYFF